MAATINDEIQAYFKQWAYDLKIKQPKLNVILSEYEKFNELLSKQLFLVLRFDIKDIDIYVKQIIDILRFALTIIDDKDVHTQFSTFITRLTDTDEFWNDYEHVNLSKYAYPVDRNNVTKHYVLFVWMDIAVGVIRKYMNINIPTGYKYICKSNSNRETTSDTEVFQAVTSAVSANLNLTRFYFAGIVGTI